MLEVNCREEPMSLGKIHKIVFAYAAISSAWIIWSDSVVELYFRDISQRVVNLNSVKGLFFVLVTSVLLYLVLKVYEKSEQSHIQHLHDSEGRYRLLVENMMDGVLLTSPDGKVYAANKAAQLLFGMTEDEICQAGRAFLVDQDDVRLQVLMQIRKETGSARGGLRFRRKSGGTFEAEVSSTLFQDDDGNARTCMILRDITDKTWAEENLQKELLRRRIVMNISNDGIAVFDKDHRIIECNNKFAEMIGYSLDEAVGLHAWDFEAVLTEEQIKQTFMNFSKVYDRFETKHRRKDGTTYDVEVSASGVVIGSEPIVVTISRDISERKKAERDILESEERFRNLFDYVDSISVQGYDSSRTVLYWNRASEVLYGYSRDEAVGRKLEDLIIPQAMRNGVIEAIRSWVDEGKPIAAGELCLKRKDGTDVNVFSSHVLQENRFGRKELFCIDIDLTELQKTREELVKSKELAELANKTKSEFLANMSHEIRTPLNGILGMAQLLATTDLDDEQKEYVEASIKSTRKLNMLLSDILDLSRIEADRLVINKHCFEFGALVKSLKDVFVLAARDKGLDLVFEIDERIPPYLVGDEARIRQVLFNILGNAIKFTKAGSVYFGCFIGSLSSNGVAHAVFMISDTGTGIDDDKLQFIFDPFTQIDGSFVREQQGVGLGLSIVKKLIRLLDGTVCVDSNLGVGTAFYVALPLQVIPGLDAGTICTTEPGASPGRRDYSVLVVEDERLNRIVAVNLLRKLGYTVSMAKDGREALDLVAGNSYDVILMDVQMPVMDGVTATKTIRHSPAFMSKSNIPIIAMTAHAMSGDRESFLAAGMDDYVSKPFDQQTLLDAINRVVAKRKHPGR